MSNSDYNKNKSYYEKNKDLIKERNRLRYHIKKAECKEYYKEYYDLNKEIILIERALKNKNNKSIEQAKLKVETYKPQIINGQITVVFGFR